MITEVTDLSKALRFRSLSDPLIISDSELPAPTKLRGYFKKDEVYTTSIRTTLWELITVKGLGQYDYAELCTANFYDHIDLYMDRADLTHALDNLGAASKWETTFTARYEGAFYTLVANFVCAVAGMAYCLDMDKLPLLDNSLQNSANTHHQLRLTTWTTPVSNIVSKRLYYMTLEDAKQNYLRGLLMIGAYNHVCTTVRITNPLAGDQDVRRKAVARTLGATSAGMWDALFTQSWKHIPKTICGVAPDGGVGVNFREALELLWLIRHDWCGHLNLVANIGGRDRRRVVRRKNVRKIRL
jgi:hypothetical protein